MPLVYVPDHHHGAPAFGGPAPSYGYPYATQAPVDPLAARKQALLADFAQSLDQLYPTNAAHQPSPYAATPYGHPSYQHQHHYLLQQQLERERAEATLLKALDEQRARRAIQQAAVEAKLRKEQERAERQRRHEAREKQALLKAIEEHALRQRIIQQRQAAYQQHVAEQRERQSQQIAAARRQKALQQLQQQQPRQQQTRRQIEPSSHPLENFLRLIGHAVDEAPRQQETEPARAPEPESSDAGQTLESFFEQLLQHCGAPSSAEDKPAPATEDTSSPKKVQPQVAYHYIPHPSVDGPSSPVSTPVSAAAAPSPSKSSTPPASRSASPPRSPPTPHSQLTALFARLRTATSSSASLKELQFRLTEMLVEADKIDAAGDASVRSRRKELVGEVEKVLSALEKKEQQVKQTEVPLTAAESSQPEVAQKTPVATVDTPAVDTQTVEAASSSTPALAVDATAALAPVSEAPASSSDHEPTKLSESEPVASATADAVETQPSEVFIPISSPPTSPRALPADADAHSDAISDASSVASPLITASDAAKAVDDDDARSVSSSTSSRRGRKAYVEDAPDEADGFQLL